MLQFSREMFRGRQSHIRRLRLIHHQLPHFRSRHRRCLELITPNFVSYAANISPCRKHNTRATKVFHECGTLIACAISSRPCISSAPTATQNGAPISLQAGYNSLHNEHGPHQNQQNLAPFPNTNFSTTPGRFDKTAPFTRNPFMARYCYLRFFSRMESRTKKPSPRGLLFFQLVLLRLH